MTSSDGRASGVGVGVGVAVGIGVDIEDGDEELLIAKFASVIEITILDGTAYHSVLPDA